MQKHKIKSGFTLVELIVVITILAILGVIAFLSLDGFGKDSRNAKRTTDISKFKTGIELYAAKASEFPIPDNYISVSDSSGILTFEGEIGNLVRKNSKMSKNFSDPKTGDNYKYSISGNKDSYEIKYFLEDNTASIFSNVYADSQNQIVTGNFNGIYIISNNGTAYSMPSIFSGITDNTVINGVDDQLNFIVNNHSDVIFIPQKIDRTSPTTIITDFYNHYSSIQIESKPDIISKIQNVNLLDYDQVYKLYIDIGLKSLGTNTVPIAPVFANCIGSTITGANGDYTYTAINHLDNTTSTIVNSQASGTETFTAIISCNDGTANIDSESSNLVCNTGFSKIGNTCVIEGFF